MQTNQTKYYAADGGPIWVQAAEIAKIYGTSASAVYKWAESGKAPSEKIQGVRRFHIPTVRQKLEGVYPIHEDDMHLFF